MNSIIGLYTGFKINRHPNLSIQGGLTLLAVFFILFNMSCRTTHSERTVMLQQFDILKPKHVKSVGGRTVIDFNGEAVILDNFIVLNNIEKVTVKNLKLISTDARGYIHVKNSKGLIFENITFDGHQSSDNRFALKISNSSGIKIENCVFQNYNLKSIRFEALVINNCPETIISHCLFKNITTKSVTRGVKIADKEEFVGSQNSKIQFCKFENIGPHKNGDAIYIESQRPDLNISIKNNDFRNIAKRYIKVNASKVKITQNRGENNLEKDMYAFISLFGDDIFIKDNHFKTLNGNTYFGITSGNPWTEIQKNITIKNNSFVNRVPNYKMKSSSVRFSTDTKGIVITNNRLEGFYFSLSSHFKNKNKVSDIKFKQNEIQCREGVKFYGDTKNLRIEN